MWTLAGYDLESRLLLGTARYPSLENMKDAIKESGTQIITLSIRRQFAFEGRKFWEIMNGFDVKILPNTAGCRSVKEAITIARLAQEIFNTNWIKLEVVGDEYTLQPDPFSLVEAARILVQEGFEVFPYITEDLVVAEKLVEAGCRILMPWGSPIGSGQGILNAYALKTLRARFPRVSLILDAGIGAPSHAAEAMELGFDGVLLNTAVSLSEDPVKMARAFTYAIQAGRLGYEAGLMTPRNFAQPSTPVIGTPFWHLEKNDWV